MVKDVLFPSFPLPDCMEANQISSALPPGTLPLFKHVRLFGVFSSKVGPLASIFI